MTIDGDTLYNKLGNVVEKSECEDIGRILIDEFDSYTMLAFTILESQLYNVIKYSDYSFCRAGDVQAGHRMVTAQHLRSKLLELKPEIVKLLNVG